MMLFNVVFVISIILNAQYSVLSIFFSYIIMMTFTWCTVQCIQCKLVVLMSGSTNNL